MTTASSEPIAFRENSLLYVLCFLFLLVWIASAIHPDVPEDWLLENLLVFFFIGLLIATYFWLPLSQTSYALIFVFLSMHEAGAHYQYAGVPAGEWMKAWFHVERNHYDRVVHFLFGFLLAYPQREVLLRKANVSRGWAASLAVMTTLALSAAFEIIEAVVASVVSPQAGNAYLGSQGDEWDSQKDMLMALFGAAISMTIVTAKRAAATESSGRSNTL